MAMTSVNIRMDSEIKQSFDQFCSEIGLTMSTAFNLFAKAALREQRIPFELRADPFYSEKNMRYLAESLKAFEEGDRGKALTGEQMDALGLEKDGHSLPGQSKRGVNVLDAA